MEGCLTALQMGRAVSGPSFRIKQTAAARLKQVGWPHSAPFPKVAIRPESGRERLEAELQEDFEIVVPGLIRSTRYDRLETSSRKCSSDPTGAPVGCPAGGKIAREIQPPADTCTCNVFPPIPSGRSPPYLTGSGPSAFLPVTPHFHRVFVRSIDARDLRAPLAGADRIARRLRPHSDDGRGRSRRRCADRRVRGASSA